MTTTHAIYLALFVIGHIPFILLAKFAEWLEQRQGVSLKIWSDET